MNKKLSKIHSIKLIFSQKHAWVIFRIFHEIKVSLCWIYYCTPTWIAESENFYFIMLEQCVVLSFFFLFFSRKPTPKTVNSFLVENTTRTVAKVSNWKGNKNSNQIKLKFNSIPIYNFIRNSRYLKSYLKFDFLVCLCSNSRIFYLLVKSFC